jgi:hypothetical protein
MSKPCKTCGRNTETVPNPIESNGNTFCSEPCHSSYLKSHGISKRNSDYPTEKKNILKRIGGLPTPLKIVTWLNVILAAINLVQALAYVSSVPMSTNIENAFGVLLSILVLIGIIQASRLIRIIVLICSWIAVIMMSLGLVFAFIQIGLQAIMILLPISISAVTIWGLSTQRSKAYFGY